MAGICGWIGMAEDGGAAVRTIDRGAQALGGSKLVRQECWIGSGIALATRGAPGSVAIATDGAVTAVVEGSVRWRTAELRAIAETMGASRALIQGYRSIGRELPTVVAGQCSFALADSARRTMLIAVDRFATRSVYYANPRPGTLIFGATPLAVATLAGTAQELDLQSLFDCLVLGAMPAASSPYHGLGRLRPAQYLWCERGRIEIGTYWDPSLLPALPAKADHLAGRLRELTVQALDRALAHAPADAAGVVLDGSVNARVVLAALGARLGRVAPSFVVMADPDDQATDQHDQGGTALAGRIECRMGPADLADALPQLARTLDEPVASAYAIATYVAACRAQAAGVAAICMGNGASVPFLAHPWFAREIALERYNAIPSWVRGSIIEPLANVLPWPAASAFVRRSKTALASRLLHEDPEAADDPTEILDPEFVAAIDPEHPRRIVENALEAGRPTDLLQRILDLGRDSAFAGADARIVQRLCHFAGVDVRFPLLDEDLAELAAAVPPRTALKESLRRRLIGQAFRDVPARAVRPEIEHRPASALDRWLLADPRCSEFARAQLERLADRGILISRQIDRFVSRSRASADRGRGSLAWRLISLACWLDAERTADAAAGGRGADSRAGAIKAI